MLGMVWIESYRRVRNGRVQIVRAHWRGLPTY